MTETDALHWQDGRAAKISLTLLAEEPLSIRVDGQPVVVVMRTPGMELDHAAGFCLAEGIVDTIKDIRNIALCDGAGSNVVAVTLAPERRARVTEILARRQYLSQTSCGICGKELVADLLQNLRPVKDERRLPVETALKHIEALDAHQPLRRLTRASHAAAIFDDHGRLLAVAEDAGRHNALDKAVGRLLREKRIDQAFVLVLSSRISYELVQKAARARIPIIVAMSRPTALAVGLATSLDMTLGCRAPGNGLFIFGDATRLQPEEYDDG